VRRHDKRPNRNNVIRTDGTTLCGNTNPNSECYKVFLQPPGVGGKIYLVRERQCWHKKCRGSTVTTPSGKKGGYDKCRVAPDHGGPGRGLGVKLSKREKQWLDLKKECL